MINLRNYFLLLPVVAAILLSGCGDGSSDVAEGGIGGSGISRGSVTGIGSITVNGVTFDTDGAAIYVEGERVDDPAVSDGTGAFLISKGFSEGQVVRVVGTFHADGRSGIADAVYYNDNVEGPVGLVTEIDANTHKVLIMGQSVIIDNQTKLENALNALSIGTGDILEVSGIRDEAGTIRAGYIWNKGTPTLPSEHDVKGVIQAIAAVDGKLTFSIESLTVDYTNADMTDIPGGTPIAGMQVEVKGAFDGTELIARRVELEHDISGSHDDEVEYEGIVTSAPVPFIAGSTFVMGIQDVETHANTVYKGGLVDNIAPGIRLEVEGYLQGSKLIANEVRFRDAIELHATVIGYNVTTKVMALNLGPNTLNVQVNELSKISGESDTTTLAQLEAVLTDGIPNDYVDVRGRILSGNLIYAEKLEIKVGTVDSEFKPEVKIQGPVANNPVTEPLITILGINVDVNEEGITKFEDANDLPIDQTTFFSLVKPENIVSVEGKLDVSGILSWEKMELEDDE